MKTVDEWSVEFDRLYDNIMSNRAPGLEPYEKSMFLTRAQEAVVIALYSGTLGEAFESTEAVTKYLSTLVRQDRIYQVDHKTPSPQHVFNIHFCFFVHPEAVPLLILSKCGCHYRLYRVHPVLGFIKYDL